MLSVMVVSRDSGFLDCVGEALQGGGVWVVCIENAGTAMEVVQRGYRPGAVIVDPDTVLEPGGGALARYIAESPTLAGVPVFSVSSAARRLELAELRETLRGLEQGGDLPRGE